MSNVYVEIMSFLLSIPMISLIEQSCDEEMEIRQLKVLILSGI